MISQNYAQNFYRPCISNFPLYKIIDSKFIENSTTALVTMTSIDSTTLEICYGFLFNIKYHSTLTTVDC